MKRLLLLLPLMIVAIICFAKEPAWLTERANEEAYVGIGSASMSESAWEEKARENALADITQQISVLIETNSFFVTMELNDSYKEYFEQTTKVSAKNLLEGHELVGSYKDKKTNTFYIGYKLDKQTYLRNKAKKEKEIADAGYGYLKEAQKALNGGNLFRSLTYFEKGLAVVEPWLFLDLRAIYNGQKIDVPNALYTGYVSAFDGLQLTLEPKELTLAGESTGEDIRLHLTRRGANVANIPLVASFAEGSGIVTEVCKTNENGIANFRLTAVNGKEKVALIRFSLAREVMSGLGVAYRKLLSTQNLPEVFCRVKVESKVKTAYLHNAGCDISTLMKQLTAFLGNNHFTLTLDPDAAEIFIEVKNTVDYAGVVPGEIYNLNENYVNLQIKFYDNKNLQLLYTYDVQQLRVLSPEKNSVEQTMAQCARELLKRLQKELPKKLTLTPSY